MALSEMPFPLPSLKSQGFPILIKRTQSSQNEIESLVNLSIKIAHLLRDIANANAIHEAQDRAVHLSEQTGRRAGACLTGIFSQRHITTPMQAIFDGPMFPNQS